MVSGTLLLSRWHRRVVTVGSIMLYLLGSGVGLLSRAGPPPFLDKARMGEKGGRMAELLSVRGWLLVGARHSMPPENFVGSWFELPHAANFKVGQWLFWQGAPGQPSLVCIEVPLG